LLIKTFLHKMAYIASYLKLNEMKEHQVPSHNTMPLGMCSLPVLALGKYYFNAVRVVLH